MLAGDGLGLIDRDNATIQATVGTAAVCHNASIVRNSLCNGTCIGRSNDSLSIKCQASLRELQLEAADLVAGPAIRSMWAVRNRERATYSKNGTNVPVLIPWGEWENEMAADAGYLVLNGLERSSLRVAVRLPVRVQVHSRDGGTPLTAWSNASDVGWRAAD